MLRVRFIKISLRNWSILWLDRRTWKQMSREWIQQSLTYGDRFLPLNLCCFSQSKSSKMYWMGLEHLISSIPSVAISSWSLPSPCMSWINLRQSLPSPTFSPLSNLKGISQSCLVHLLHSSKCLIDLTSIVHGKLLLTGIWISIMRTLLRYFPIREKTFVGLDF